jgi:hypothetical protein
MQWRMASSYAHLLGRDAIGEAAYATNMQACQTRRALDQVSLRMLDSRPHVRRSASHDKGSTKYINLGNTQVECSRRFW